MSEEIIEKKILVAEDDPTLRVVMAKVIKMCHGNSVIVTSAEDAVEKLATDGPFDGLITDLVMTGPMSGLDLARFAREKHPNMPIVITSGMISDEIGKEAERAGVEFVLKPFDVFNLVSKVGLKK